MFWTAAFSLIELLVVMAIVVVMLGLAVPAMTTISKSSNLNNAGRLFSNLLTIARSEAINQRTIVRVEVATDWPPDSTYRYRKATLTKAVFVPTAGTTGAGQYVYRQFTGWETIPDGIVFEPSDPAGGSPTADGSKYLFDSVTLGNSNTTLTIGSETVPTIYLAFTPTGAISPSSGNIVPVRARLTEGFVPSGTTTIIHTHKGSPNWFDIRVNALVGRIEIGRPESPLP